MSNGTTKSKTTAKVGDTKATVKTEKTESEDTTYEAVAAEEGRPVRYEEVAKSKDGKKYTKGTKGAQKVFEGANRSAERVAQGAADGLKEYRKRSEKSAKKKKDGQLKDLPYNAAKGFGEAVRTASEAPADIAKELKPKRIRKALRNIPGSPF